MAVGGLTPRPPHAPQVAKTDEERHLESFGWRHIKTIGGKIYWHNALSGEMLTAQPDVGPVQTTPRPDFEWRARAEVTLPSHPHP